jgi:hypothetical protein
VVIHSINDFIAENKDKTNVSVALLDQKNAFNEIDRAQCLKGITEYVPELSRFAHDQYSLPTKVLYDGKEIDASQGTVQGCGISVVQFSAGAVPLVQHMEKIISSAEGDKLMLAIVDDITVCSKTSAIVEVISSVNPSPPPEVGRFFLNVSKTISFPTCLAGPSSIPDPTPSGMPEGVVCM